MNDILDAKIENKILINELDFSGFINATDLSKNRNIS